MKQELPQDAWENFIMTFACSLKLDKFCLWLSKKLENKIIKLIIYGVMTLITLIFLFIFVIQIIQII